MPHSRERLALARLLKKLRFFPVVAIQGARQTGKSFLARELLPPKSRGASYFSLDQATTRAQVHESPHTFLLEHEAARPLMIDEAQKVPDLFDAIKFEVDARRAPGRFLLLGSTEFSRMTLIRESLTGRMGRIQLYPLNLREAVGLGGREPARTDLLRYLKNGGMPGIFAVREEGAQNDLFQDWVDLTCQRDIHQFPKLKLDGDLAYGLLKLSATLPEPTQSAMARALRTDGRKVGTHLRALCALFVLQKLAPHPSGTGKPIFLPVDAGIARFLGAPRSRCLHVWLLVERMSANAYSVEKRRSFSYYRSPGKNWVHLVEERIGGGPLAFQVFEGERIRKTDVLLLKAFLARNPGAKGALLAPVPERMKVAGVWVEPWEVGLRARARE